LKRAFTLIELLVVIAIIAILAAILFPVFAQAKMQAKKAADLSNLKQSGVAFLMYTNDADDLFPLGYRFIPDAPGTVTGTWGWNFNVSTPLGWMGPSFAQGQAARMAQDASHWSNTVQPYIKNFGIYQAPGLSSVNVYVGYPDSGNAGQLAAPAQSNMTFNGLLHAWPTTAIDSPSSVPLIWAGRGKGNADGASLSNPALYCPKNVSVAPCIYNAAASPQGVFPAGYMFTIYTSMWEYTKGANFTMTDSSSKYRVLGGTLSPGNTDYKTDPYTGYDANGNPGFFWCNTGPCYPYIFRPDFHP